MAKNVLGAKMLRRRTTLSERLLWKELRDRRFRGLKFRRQHPVGPFVIDFYCEALRLGVEVDGAVHDAPAQRRYDGERAALLLAEGIHLVRLRAGDVEANAAHALAEVFDALGEGTGPPPASPSPAERERGQG